jgi:hypothetical protein
MTTSRSTRSMVFSGLPLRMEGCDLEDNINKYAKMPTLKTEGLEYRWWAVSLVSSRAHSF